MIFKKIIKSLSVLLIASSLSSKIYAAEECFEKASRSIFKFNMMVDDAIIEPIAKGYNKLPRPLKEGTSNFTNNISTLLSIPTSLLQGNFNQFAHSTGSVILNSTIGVFGILNPAEKIGLKPSKEDFGQTLGSYGLGSGCYFVLPILGPTTVRDSVGLLVDSYLDPFAHVTIREKELFSISGNNLDYYSVKSATAVDFRSDNLTNFDSVEKNSLDLYSSFKSIYLQDRSNKIKNSLDDQDDWGNLEN
tara:strand:- start:585 stop:1325 length:741 start_codon:yes stop_codon:yes gene_type:complete